MSSYWATSPTSSAALGAPSTRSQGSQPSCFLAYWRRGLLGALSASSALSSFAGTSDHRPAMNAASSSAVNVVDDVTPRDESVSFHVSPGFGRDQLPSNQVGQPGSRRMPFWLAMVVRRLNTRT